MQSDDPYDEIKQEVEYELLHATQLRNDLFAGNGAAAEQLTYQLQNVTEQLSALEAAVQLMVDQPGRFQLDADTAGGRQVEVEKLRWQLQDLQVTCAQVETSTSSTSRKANHLKLVGLGIGGYGMLQSEYGRSGSNSNSRAPHQIHKQATGNGKPQLSVSSSNNTMRALPTSSSAMGNFASQHRLSPPHKAQSEVSTGTGRSGWDSNDWDSYEDAVQQQVVDQDQTLDHISVHVERIKQTGQAMHDELEEQSLLLGGLQEDTDSSQLRLRGLRRQVQDVIRRSRTDRQLCWILLLLILLVVITLIAIA